ncbi:MAG: replication-associated recombination protein A [Clostridiales bacterium]|mgnify:FL=1|jgi:putative ATPase|nr:replication-associated recombination protein A [Clostridium sp.]MCI6946777.1 replication-associated recombination protein A [Clostridiales bacterium]MDY2721422.1 replication-associated recombination protein A [Eubacteriales bacterium]MEE0399919.1 replication-associated recombination protein A [Christensenellales bacterium]CDD09546.1 recombination factor protein RarA [Clostridium sp. CAG:349]
MDLFEYANQQNDGLKPLAERMRPQTLNEFIGQEHIVGEGSLLRRAIAADRLGSCIFYGPPGTGKTTLANIIAKNTNSHFEILNAVSSGVADAKRVIEEAKNRLMMYGKKTYLLLDECHRWNKAQSDSVLSAIEQGYIVFIGSTTENPYVSMTKAIVSRCRLFEFHSLTDKDVLKALNRAINDKRGLLDMNVVAEEGALEHLAWASGGDVRTALNALELAAVTTSASADGAIHITKEIAAQSIQKRVLSISDDNYYDMLSAFCKSLRGSDSNAGLYWAMRLIDAGCDPLLIFRRIIAHSAEDVGMANPNALVVATSALTAYEKIGMPEGTLPLAEAIICVCESEKSNSVVIARDEAERAVQTVKKEAVPMYLRDVNYKQEKISGYKYPHDYGGYVEQQYLPDDLKDAKFYVPSDHGYEKVVKERQERLKKL